MGDILHVDLAMNRNSGLTKKTMTWRDDHSQNGSSGACGDLGSHLLDLVGYISGSQITKNFLTVASGIRVPTRGAITLTEDDHCVMVGTTESKVIFKVQASKTAEASELGLHIHITLRKGEIHYSSTCPDRVCVKSYSCMEKKEIKLGASRIIDDPKTEAAYWSDSFYLQNKLWIEQIITGRAEKSLASIQTGVELQDLVSVGYYAPT
jgi:predicted dehydrogenase